MLNDRPDQLFTTDEHRCRNHDVALHRSGKQLDADCCIVFEVEDGRIKSGTEHFFDLHNWDQFWS